MATINGTANNEELYGFATDDTINGFAGDDGIWGGGGSDVLNGGDGGDWIFGDEGNDVLDGSNGDDLLDGGTGDDTLDGGGGNDRQYGDVGNDILSGSDGNDSLNGGDGNDVLNGGEGADYMEGGEGNGSDVLNGGDGGDWIFGDEGNDVLDGSNGDDLLDGGTGDDTLDGGGGNDRQYGDVGNDILSGSDGNDSLNGGDGNDVLNGGEGADYMEGGEGNDTYYVDSLGDYLYDIAGSDTVVVATGLDNYKSNIFGGGDIESVTYQSADTLRLAYFIDALTSGSSWSVTGVAANVNFSFVETSALAGFVPYTAAEKTLVRSIMAEYAAVSGLVFQEVTDAEAVQIRMFKDGSPAASGSAGYAYYPTGGDVHMDPGYAGNYHLLFHEIGHALGLKHPGDYSGDGSDAPFLPAAEDTTDNTQMSYNGYGEGGNYFRLFDMAAIHYLYGVNAAARFGNESYTQNDRYIWDGSGIDTLSMATATQAATVDLRDGAWSWCGSKAGSILADNQFFIGCGTVIENAVGSQWSDSLRGNEIANDLYGGLGNDKLDGWLGADKLYGSLGDDTYVVDNVNDMVMELLNEGTDEVSASVSWTLGANVENLTLTGTALTATGNSLANLLTGNSSNNTLTGGSGNDTLTGLSGADLLDGGAGADTLIGGLAGDTYVVDNTGDIVTELLNEGTDTVQASISYTLGANLERLVLTGASNLSGVGNDLANTLTGNSGHNRLNGGAGADTLNGGLGNDTYVVETSGETLNEAVDAGTDAVETFLTWTLGANLENLTLNGSAAINGYGNSLNNVITGNSGGNTLRGNGGTDTLTGGAGDDRYYIDSTDDVVTELAAEGSDFIYSTVSLTLGANLERLYLQEGFATALNATGNSLANNLTGNSLGNILEGGTGDDTLGGRGGNDTYYADSGKDIIEEFVGDGTDEVYASASFSLRENVEHLTLTGTAVSGIGNLLNNRLTGNGSDNVLKGGGGTDTLTGGLGNDTYYVDTASDVVTELAGEGTDYLYTTVSLTLGSNLERLYLLEGSATALEATGNSLNNAITGNSLNNVLRGGGGADTLTGRGGNDRYYVDSTDDIVEEYVGEGTDEVYSSVSLTLRSQVENLRLTGVEALNGRGNELANVLTGNSGANLLTGGLGNDTYTGGRGMGVDTVVENDSTAGNTDVLNFLTGVAHTQLWFTHAGNNLEVSIIGTNDKAVLKDWYTGAANRVEQIQTLDGGKVLQSGNVEALVTAMALLTPPVLGQTSLTVQQLAALDVVIAASWS